jgi:hypothetical protein
VWTGIVQALTLQGLAPDRGNRDNMAEWSKARGKFLPCLFVGVGSNPTVCCAATKFWEPLHTGGAVAR